MPRFLWLFVFAVGWGFQSLSGQTSLHLLDPSALPIPGATILDVATGTALGATNADGLWELKGPCSGLVEVRVSAMGYISQDFSLRCGVRLTVRLEPDVILIGGATVVGSLAPMSLKESPIRTQVLSGAALRSIPADDAVEALDFTNGVRETVGCGVCGTQDIHINGLEGVYTLVLLDGVPLLGGLASAYALDGLPLSMVQQVEVIQGPASARFGSQAVGGVINIVLQPIENSQSGFLMRTDAHGRWVANAGWTAGGKRLWQFGADGQRFTRRLDENSDGITDAPTIERLVLTARHKTSGRSTLLLRGMAERRFGGQLDFQESDRGGEVRYGERVDLWRAEGIWSQSPSEQHPLRLLAGGAFHRQESTYGTTEFNATSWVANSDLLWNGLGLGADQHLRGGASLQWELYSDETPVASDMNLLLPALFLEESGKTGALSWIVGLRAEKPLDLAPGSNLPSAPILAPRLNVKWAIRPTLDARLNVGRGYRRIHLFTEEHAALDGSRVVRVEGDLTPELSWNANGSANWTVGGERWFADIDLHAFATQFTNRLLADYNAEPNAIIYRNMPGVGWTRGIGVDVSTSGATGWKATVGATWMRAEVEDDNGDGDAVGPREIEFAPRWTVNGDCGWRWKDWSVGLQGQRVGPMRLPAVEGFALHSDPYTLLHLSCSRKLGRHTLRGGWKNLTDTRQPTPLIAADQPFSEAFDASRVYGPIEGRRAFIEWSMTF